MKKLLLLCMVFYAMPASFGQVSNYQVGDVVDNLR